MRPWKLEVKSFGTQNMSTTFTARPLLQCVIIMNCVIRPWIRPICCLDIAHTKSEIQIWSLSNLFNLPKVSVCLQMHQYSKWSWLKNPSMMQNIILEQFSLDWEWMIRLHVKVFALSLNAFENIWWIPISEFNQNRAKLRFFFDPAFLLQSISIFNLRKPCPQRKYGFSSLKKFHHIRKNRPLLIPKKTFLRLS